MKKVIYALHIIIASFLLQACHNDAEKTDSVEKAKNMNAKKDSLAEKTGSVTADSLLANKEAADFAVTAANISMMEIELGKLARRHAASKRVKDLAALVIQDHRDAVTKLKKIALEKNIVLPAKPGAKAQKIIDTLSKKKGVNFDSSYIHLLADNTKKAADDYKKASDGFLDTAFKNFSVPVLHALLLHLDYAKAISSKK